MMAQFVASYTTDGTFFPTIFNKNPLQQTPQPPADPESEHYTPYISNSLLSELEGREFSRLRLAKCH